MINTIPSFETHSLGQFLTLQFLLEVLGPRPLQFFPPFAGGGLVQVRLRNCSPPPHDFEQSPYGPHEE